MKSLTMAHDSTPPINPRAKSNSSSTANATSHGKTCHSAKEDDGELTKMSAKYFSSFFSAEFWSCGTA